MRLPQYALAASALLAGYGGLAWAQPTINDNFVARVTVVTGGRSTPLTIYDWYSGDVIRFDSSSAQGQSNVFQFLPGAEVLSCNTGIQAHFPTGSQYIWDGNTTCTHSPLLVLQPVPSFWGFLAKAKQNGTCSSNGRSGTLWVYEIPLGSNPTTIPVPFAKEIEVCANGNTPISMIWLGPSWPPSSTLATYLELDFTVFIPGVPPQDDYCLPNVCATGK